MTTYRKDIILGMTTGCFDLFHKGHADYLNACLEQCDWLFILVNSDESVRKLKGEGRPVNKWVTRRKKIYGYIRQPTRGWREHDKPIEVMKFEGDATELAKKWRPEIMFAGEEYRETGVLGSEYAGKVVFIPRFGDISTTKIIEERKREASKGR